MGPRLAIFWLHVQQVFYTFTGGVGDYFNITRRAFQCFAITLALGLVLPILLGHLSPSLGNGVATLAIIIGGFFGAVVIGRLSLAGAAGIDLPSGILPDRIRDNVSFLRRTTTTVPPTGATTTTVATAQATQTTPATSGSVGKFMFQGMSLGGLWTLAALLIPALLPVWEHTGTYLLSISLIVLIIYYLGYKWENAGVMTNYLRWFIIAMLAWAILSMALPAYKLPLLIVALTLAYYIGAPKTGLAGKALEVTNAVVLTIAGLLLVASLFPGLWGRINNRFQYANDKQTIVSESEARINQTKLEKYREYTEQIEFWEKQKAIYGGLKPEDQKILDAYREKRDALDSILTRSGDGKYGLGETYIPLPNGVNGSVPVPDLEHFDNRHAIAAPIVFIVGMVIAAQLVGKKKK